MISMTSRPTTTQILDRQFAGRLFEVRSIASGEALSKPMSFNQAFDELENIGGSNATYNGIDLREVK